MRQTIHALAGALLALCAPRDVRAQTTTLDFTSLGSLPCNSSYGGPGAVFDGPTYTTNGYTFTSSGPVTNAFQTWCPTGGGYTGSPSLFANTDYSILTLTRELGGLFSIHSISLATLYAAFPGSLSVQFTGTLSNASQVFETFSFPGRGALTPLVFLPGFVDLVSLEWEQGSTTAQTSYQFDNVVLTAATVTPEPGSLVLTATGILLLGALARRRKLPLNAD